MPTLCNRRLLRETTASVFSAGERRRIILQLELGGRLLRLRLKGTRQWHTVSVDQVFRLAVQVTADQLRRDRRQARQ